MVATERLIELVQPAAAALLDEDAAACAQLVKRRASFASLDHQPAAAAVAGERRAIVATAMRATIAPGLGWALIDDNLQCGAYEWAVGDVLVRLSKTNRASRLEAALALAGVQGALFPTVADPAGPKDEVMIRLMGSALNDPSVDVVSVDRGGRLSSAIPLRAIAAAQAVKIPGAGAPVKTRVTLPGTRRDSETG